MCFYAGLVLVVIKSTVTLCIVVNHALTMLGEVGGVANGGTSSTCLSATFMDVDVLRFNIRTISSYFDRNMKLTFLLKIAYL